MGSGYESLAGHLVARAAQVLLVAGFFVALVLAWYHGERGHQEVSASEAALLVALLAVGGVGAVWAMRSAQDRPPEPLPPSASGPPALVVDPVSIAVLPFTHSQAQGAGDLLDDLHADLLMQLDRVTSLGVTSGTSVRKFAGSDATVPEIAAELGVTSVMEARLQLAEDHVSLNARLVDGQADTTIWSKPFIASYSVEGMREMQADIADQIAEALSAELSPQQLTALAMPPTESMEAYQIFHTGFGLHQQGFFEEAIAAYDQAIELDPQFALAYARRSTARNFLVGQNRRPRTEWPLVIADAERAKDLDADLPAADVALGRYAYNFERDFEEAERYYLAALQSEASSETLNLLATIRKRTGRFMEAVPLSREAAIRNPLRAAL